MALPWVRLDTNIPSHDKVLNLLSDPSPKRWQAGLNFVFSFAWSGGHGTDGRIPKAALPFIHANEQTAKLLVQYGLWTPATGAWEIPNYLERQELEVVSAGKRAARTAAALKANCVRHHGKDCGCWRQEGGLRCVT
jgi:hypothetical protein